MAAPALHVAIYRVCCKVTIYRVFTIAQALFGTTAGDPQPLRRDRSLRRIRRGAYVDRAAYD
ncbi:MAG TPA: hypothetical protein VFM87_05185, partial [Agrococcus sp.]|nr:hypothetical protein [Agrococcus sp.]